MRDFAQNMSYFDLNPHYFLSHSHSLEFTAQEMRLFYSDIILCQLIVIKELAYRQQVKTSKS